MAIANGGVRGGALPPEPAEGVEAGADILVKAGSTFGEVEGGSSYIVGGNGGSGGSLVLKSGIGSSFAGGSIGIHVADGASGEGGFVNMTAGSAVSDDSSGGSLRSTTS